MTLPVQPVVLATDALFFLLLLLGAYAVFAIRRSGALEPWRKLARSRGAMVSLTILLLTSLLRCSWCSSVRLMWISSRYFYVLD